MTTQQKQTKTELFKKFKIDLLLRLNSTMTAVLGIDSSEEEKSFVNKLREDNLKKIKEIDSEFFKSIEEDE